MDTYGMTPEEQQRRDQLIANLLAHPENPNNASVAQMISQGPYRINDGGGGPPAPQQNPYPQPMVNQPGYISVNNMQTPSGGSADILRSSPIQGPVINPTNPTAGSYASPPSYPGTPAARSGLGQVAPQSAPPPPYQDNPAARSGMGQAAPSSAPVSINVYASPPPSQQQDQQPNRMGIGMGSHYAGGAPDMSAPRYNFPDNSNGQTLSGILPTAIPSQGMQLPTTAGGWFNYLGTNLSNYLSGPAYPPKPPPGNQPNPVVITNADGSTQHYDSSTHQWVNLPPTFGNLSR